MRVAKVTFVILAAALLAAGISTTSYAFHSGGVAECEGCHSMHNPSQTGVGANYLLVGDTQSSTCLSCHGKAGAGSYHIATPPADLGAGSAPYNMTPGGDFGWLEKTYTFVIRGNTVTEDGTHHGHDINAGSYASWGTTTNNATAPGGTFPQAQLACNSCHDPHGQFRRTAAQTIVKTGFPIMASGSYPGAGNEPTATEAVGVYRLLAGAGYTKDGVTFGGNPAAKVPSTYNRSEATTQTRTAYGTSASGSTGHVNWGTWCATCHADFHTTSGRFVHKQDANLGATVSGLYGNYVKSGDMTGSPASSFLSLVSFAKAATNYPGLATLAVNTDTQLGGPTANDQVMCLSCHRAHASGFPYMLRWAYEYEFMTKAGSYVADVNVARGRTQAEAEAAYYGRPATKWATYQRVLCNKCHAKD